MKRSHILLLCCFLIVASLIAGSLFLLKPAVEREFTARVNEYFTGQGLVPESPIETTVNPISRTLTIHPFVIQSNPKLKIKQGTFKEAELSLTWQGLLAFSSLSSLVPKSGEIPLLNQGKAEGVRLSVEDADITLENARISHVSLDANDLELLKSGRTDILRTALVITDITLDKMTITGSEQKNQLISFGPLYVTGAKKNRIEQCVVENIALTENNTRQIAMKRLTQKNIRLHTEEEWLALAETLSGPSQEAAAAFFDLLMGENPLVESTVFDTITFTVDETPLTIDQIIFNTAKNAENTLFSISRMTIPSKAIEDQAGQRLPLPSVLHLSFSLAAKKDAGKNYALSGNVGIEELLDIDTSLLVGISSLKNFDREILKAPLKNFRLRLTDKSLLARISLYLAPDGSGKKFLKQQLLPSGDTAIDAKILSFIENPGSIEISSTLDKTFTIPQLEAMSEQQVMKALTFTVTPGQMGLDAQITALQNEK